ncbi:hypothetical protein [Mycobacterium sp.]|jgi:hypothetical protein|uniref:hypothetical protein n=1 Tax=Mycobacterium sp. TaxID=1785 RepID=UPI002D359118|nr:hypothetical protein [Mycobacterium sp.]HZA09314.1 hypothetical protein [Mycobacterium sp.]
MSDTARGLQSTQPHTASALLRTLHASEASVMTQRVVLREWLVKHTPDKGLRVSLRQNGYGLLLDDIFGRIARHSKGHG